MVSDHTCTLGGIPQQRCHACALTFEAKCVRDAETCRLADAYRDACAAIPDFWATLLDWPAMSPARHEAVQAYRAAQEPARDAHRALIDHAAAGGKETA